MTVNDHSFHYRVLLISSIVIASDGFILIGVSWTFKIYDCVTGWIAWISSTLSCKIGGFLYNDAILLTKTKILVVKWL